MKKLIVVLIVLSMASAANAQLTLTISGPTSIATNAVGTYTIGYSIAYLSNRTLIVSDVDIICDLGTIGGGVILTTNRDTEYDWTAANPISGNYEVTIVNDIRATDLGSPLFSFQLTAPNAVGVAHISLIENAFFNDNWEAISPDSMPTMTVTISVPEPMTLGLLGLGGLFLRRRK